VHIEAARTTFTRGVSGRAAFEGAASYHSDYANQQKLKRREALVLGTSLQKQLAMERCMVLTHFAGKGPGAFDLECPLPRRQKRAEVAPA
jgi:hypothetical protein